MTTAVGPRSEQCLEEIGRLKTARAQTTNEVNGLVQEVGEREDKLNRARAAGVIDKVDRATIAAFEAELTALQSQLAEKRSTLAGLGQLLATKAEELETAQIADAHEVLLTKEMGHALTGLEKNARALDKTRAAILQRLEDTATALLGELEPHQRRWTELIEERQDLYIRRYKALGAGARGGDSAYNKMRKDRHVQLFSSNGQEEAPEIAELAEFLHPLIASGRGRR